MFDFILATEANPQTGRAYVEFAYHRRRRCHVGATRPQRRMRVVHTVNANSNATFMYMCTNYAISATESIHAFFLFCVVFCNSRNKTMIRLSIGRLYAGWLFFVFFAHCAKLCGQLMPIATTKYGLRSCVRPLSTSATCALGVVRHSPCNINAVHQTHPISTPNWITGFADWTRSPAPEKRNAKRVLHKSTCQVFILLY